MPMPKGISEQEGVKIIETMNKLEPLLHKYIMRHMVKSSPTVGLSIATNMATTLMTICIIIVEKSGGDVQSFIDTFMGATNEKYQIAKYQNEKAEEQPVH